MTSAELARNGRIDPPESLRDDRVWLFSGGRDHTVDSSVVDALAAFYREWLPAEAIRHVKLPEAGHAMISTADREAKACDSAEAPFINRCGEFDAAGELLQHLLGPLQPPVDAQAAALLVFDQRRHVSGNLSDAGLDKEGYAYVPAACRQGGCRVHVVFHGCRQGASQIGRRFVEGAGYNRWAEANRLIVLYPQVAPRLGAAWGSTDRKSTRLNSSH